MTVVSLISLAVGLIALGLPFAVLESKGVVPNGAAIVWVREVGVLLLALGTIAFAIRKHQDSSTLRAFLIGNAIVHAGLLPIEIIAFAQGVITKASGIIPNSVLHVVMTFAFLYYARRIGRPH